MGKRDRERRERGDFLVKHKPPTAPQIARASGRLVNDLMWRLKIAQIWAMRRPLPPEEAFEADETPAGPDQPPQDAGQNEGGQ